jgi:hypothetical protein
MTCLSIRQLFSGFGDSSVTILVVLLVSSDPWLLLEVV